VQKCSSRLTGGTERMEPTQPRLSCIFVSRSFRRLIRFVAITSSGSGPLPPLMTGGGSTERPTIRNPYPRTDSIVPEREPPRASFEGV
jgi:hypothetical protein